ncbi:hypothetical protein ACLB2K_000931 [Fragaria x ananassa]
MAVKPRHGRVAGRKSSSSSSSSTLVLTLLVMFTFVILILLALGILSVPSGSSGDSPKANDLSSIVRNSAEKIQGDDRSKEQWVEVISWEPRAFVYHNFLTQQECDYLIDLAKPHMEKSTVVDSETGKSKDSRVRTSSGTFLSRGRDKVIRNIERKIANFTFLPVEHGEGLQILHYEVGQKYEPHFDYFQDEYNTRNGGQRMATILMYLSDVEEGGETVFPNAKGNISSILQVCMVGVLSSGGINGHLLNGFVWTSTKFEKLYERLYKFLCYCCTFQNFKPEVQYLCFNCQS